MNKLILLSMALLAGCATRSPDENALIRRQLDERIALRERERATSPQSQSLAAEFENKLFAQDAEKAQLNKHATTCLPHTGCALQDETSEQFEQRKIIEETITKDRQAKSAQKEKDMAVCRYEATKATGSSQRGYTVYSTIFNDVGDTFRQVELIGLCMKSKGYT